MNKSYKVSAIALCVGGQILAGGESSKPNIVTPLRLAYEGLETGKAGLGNEKMVEVAGATTLLRASIEAMKAQAQNGQVKIITSYEPTGETTTAGRNQAITQRVVHVLEVIKDIPVIESGSTTLNLKKLEEDLQKEDKAELVRLKDSNKALKNARDGLAAELAQEKTKSQKNFSKEVATARKGVDDLVAELSTVQLSWVARYPKTAIAISAIAGSVATVGTLRYLGMLQRVAKVAPRKR